MAAQPQHMHPEHDGGENSRLHDLVESQARVMTDQARLIRSLRELRERRDNGNGNGNGNGP